MYQKLKSLASDTIIYGLSSILGRFLSFILTPVYTNYLTTAEYDFVIYSFSIVAFLNVLYSFGLESAFFRFYSSDNKSESKKVFTNSYIFINIISFVVTLFLIIFSSQFGKMIASPKISNPGFLFSLAVMMPFLDALTYIPFGYLRMSRQAKKFAITKFSIILISVVFNFVLLIAFGLQAEGVFISQIIASGAAVLLFIPLIYQNFSKNLDFKLLMNMLKFGIPTIPASVSAIILQVADRPILKELTNSEIAITTYQVNYRLGIPMMIFVTVFEYAWKPFYLSTYQETDSKQTFSRVLTYFTLFSSLIFLFFTFFMEYFVQIPFIGGKLINPKYWDGLHIIPIILGAYFFNGIFTNFSAGFLIEKRTSYLPVAVGTAAIINVAANFLLIPYFGYTGAAWATLIAYFVSALILYIYGLKIYPVRYEWKRIAIIIICAMAIFAVSQIINFNFGILLNILAKSLLILIFIFLLKVFGFFNKEEKSFIKRFIKSKGK